MTCAIMKFTGDFDLIDRAAISEALRACKDETVVIDLSDASYIDSTILGTFVMLEKAKAERNLQVRYVLGNSPVRRIIRMTGLDLVFDIFQTLDGATAFLDVTRTRDFASHAVA